MTDEAFEVLKQKVAEGVFDSSGKSQLYRNNGLGKNDTKVPCVIPSCKGTIFEEKSEEYLGDPGHRIIGPGYRKQLTLVTKFYCSQCGLNYRDIPK